MRSVYGPHAEEVVPDTVWLERAGRAGWIVLTKDDAIRRRPVELDALVAYGVRAFCLTNANLTGEQQRQRIVGNVNRMVQRAHKPGPWICAVHDHHLVQIWPRPRGRATKLSGGQWTTRRGRCSRRRRRVATEPRSMQRSRPPPWVPTTIRSASTSVA